MDLSLSFQEKVIFGLRALYRSYGYTQYKMSKFEEYDLYCPPQLKIEGYTFAFPEYTPSLRVLK